MEARRRSLATELGPLVARSVGFVRHRWPILLVGFLAALPALRMALWVRSGTHVQFTDYWVFLSEFIAQDGSVNWRALAEFQGQHLLLFTQLIYLVNIWLFGGSNITLGYIVVAIVLGQLLVIGTWLRSMEGVPRALKGGLLVFSSAVLFSPYGAWNFIRSMSGAAWLTANLIVLASIHFAARDRTWISIGLAVLATLTYGTGVVAWPVVAFIILLRRRPVIEVMGTLAVGALVVGTYLNARSGQVRTNTMRSVSLDEVVANTARIVGRIAGLHSQVVLGVGCLLLVAFIVLIPLALIRCRDQALPFVGVACFGVLSAAQVSYGRTGGFGGSSNIMASRYTSLSALTWIGTACLVVVVARSFDFGRWNRAVAGSLLVPLVLVSITMPFRGHVDVRHSLDEAERILQLSDAQRIKVSEARRWFLFIEQPDIDDRLEKIGHHPFDGRWDADCGMLGEVFDRTSEAAEGVARTSDVSNLSDGVIVRGRVGLEKSEIDCVLVLDDSRSVVGAGRPVASDSDEGVDLVAFAPKNSKATKLVFYVTDDDRWLSLDVSDGEAS